MENMKKQLFLILFILVLLFTVSCGKKVDVDSKKMDENYKYWANANAVISPASLEELMKTSTNLIIIGTINPVKSSIPNSVESKPIKNSYLVWRNDYSGANGEVAVSTNVDGVIKSQEDIEMLLSKAGATPDSTIVVYSSGDMHDAGRLYWQFKHFGIEDVKMLDGGLNAWEGETGKPKLLTKENIKTDFKVSPNYDMSDHLASIDDVIMALANTNDYVVIDTRTVEENKGEETGSSKGACGVGGIKGAVFIPWNMALKEDDNTLKSREELEKIYGAYKDKEIILFCQSGVRSAHTYFVLKDILGYDVKNYDGSWIEWSYVASEFSKDVDEKLKVKVLENTSKWTDNNGKI